MMNIFENTDNKEDYLRKYYTVDGLKALNKRLETLTTLYIKKQKYPFKTRVFGFLMLKIHSKVHHEGMIDELSQLLGQEKVEMEIR